MAQANQNNACECHLQAAQAETQVLGSATRQPKHQSGKVKQSQGDLSVTNELKYACRPQGEQTGKTLHKIFPDKAGPGPPAKSPNLRGGARAHCSHFTHPQPATTGGWGRVPSRGSLQTHTPCGPTYPNKLARDITTVDLNTAKGHNTCLLAKQGLLCLNSANVTTQDRLSAQDHPQPRGTQHPVPAD